MNADIFIHYRETCTILFAWSENYQGEWCNVCEILWL